MKNNRNLIGLIYNKYDFYHNEWYTNVYSYIKYKNTNNNIHINFLYLLFNIYFNKINKFSKKLMNNNSINILYKYISNNTNNMKESIIPMNVYNSTIKNYNKNYNKNDNLYKNLISRIYFNIMEIKHYSNKIIIHICIYNREKLFLLRKIKLLNIKTKKILFNIDTTNNNILLLEKKLSLLNNKIYLYKYYTSKLFFNNMKFNTYNLFKLKNILSNIFSKKILFDITNVKYFHLNNSILLDSLTKKLNKDRKSSILKLIRKGLRFAKIAKLHFLLKVKRLDTYLSKEIKGNYTNVLGLKNNINIINNIFNKGVNMHIVGLRLESKGRLTKRLVASRAIKKLKYKGSLSNIYSSINKNSVLTYKGFEKSNINYLTKTSHNLLGSYGIKYWTSSY